MRVAIIAALTLAAAGSAFAQCVNSGTTSAFLGSNINLLAGSGASNSLLSSGTAFWSGNCTGMGQTFPGFTVGGGGTGPTYTVQVLGHNGSGDGACGAFSGGTVKLWTSTDRNGQPFSCGDTAMNLAHEIGHLLGLPDASMTSSCTNFIMAELKGDGSNRNTRSIQGEECSDADTLWTTAIERDQHDPGEGGQCDPI